MVNLIKKKGITTCINFITDPGANLIDVGGESTRPGSKSIKKI